MSHYFPNQYEHYGGNVKLELDQSSITTKADLKEAAGVDTSKRTSKSNLPDLKVEIDKLDTDKLKPVSADLRKLGNTISNHFVKKLYKINWSQKLTLLIL